MADLSARQLWWCLAGAATVFLLALLPLYSGGYIVSLFIVLFANIALATAWSFFSGAAGYVSLATAAFLGLGVYTIAVLHSHVPIALALLAATVVGFLVALVVGLSTLRLRGVYFVIFTFGLTELLQQVIAWWEITRNHTMSRYIITNVSSTVVFEILLAIALLTVLGSWYVSRTRLGYALRCIGADEMVARHTGIDTTRVKVLVFAVSAGVMALVGAVLSLRYRYIDPAVAFNNVWSFQVLIAALLGGPSRPWGPAVGAVPLVLLSDFLAGTFPHHFGIALGLCFVVIVYFLSGGIAPLLERCYHSWSWSGATRWALPGWGVPLVDRHVLAREWCRAVVQSLPALMAPFGERCYLVWLWSRGLVSSLPRRVAPLAEQYHRYRDWSRSLAASLPGRIDPLVTQCRRGWDWSRVLAASLPGRMAPLVASFQRYWNRSRALASFMSGRIMQRATRCRQSIGRRLLPSAKRRMSATTLRAHRERADDSSRP